MNESLAQLFHSAVHPISDRDILNPSLTEIVLPDGAGNDENCTELEFLNLPRLKTISIRDSSFIYVKKFLIDGLNKLTSVKIGKKSFTLKYYGYGNDSQTSFCISNCNSLETLSIDEFSFTDFGGEFTLKNLPKLSSVSIGSPCKNSLNFYSSSFVLRGTMQRSALIFV